MVKFNPQFDGPVSEFIDDSIDALFYKIEHVQGMNHDDVILKYIKSYYEVRAYIKNIFSEEFLNIVQKEFILGIWNIKKEDFEIKESIEEKILDYLLDVFLEHYSNSKFKCLEIED